MSGRQWKALILDMNGTFMFGHDRFGPQYDYFRYYQTLGGQLSACSVNEVLTNVYDYLARCYEDPAYQEHFPTLNDAINQCQTTSLPASEVNNLIQTFSYFEMGQVSTVYADYLGELARRYKLAAVIDIWAPPQAWVSYFQALGIWDLFDTVLFSSVHGMVKPSPKPYHQVVEALSVASNETLVVGDNPSRDLLGAQHAGIECVLVGGACSDSALACIDSLLDLDNILSYSS